MRINNGWIRVGNLRALAKTLEIEHRLEFVLNQPFPVLKEWLQNSSVGLHTMWNEHFGIGIVEMMNAGLGMIVHDSGGPKSDIITLNRMGYLAALESEYETAMHTVS
uniref:Glycosyl transferase family 1 domain-containing protein n=1 Tax=Proboscia inermis TaxID=420281 RepID=A0A7S0CCI6_9STRA|mmetsp:Transcript_37509/g.37859  ORF Transcript_37509/g.37859 Transcript_37509/m.37859 type:complete len:107 (+) Transcript_37509:1045-1365(+)|eukprot:CAMPEP_0171314046 /NCGR_PEP_ID=MMETSP0816-20121228/48115_1 /TAXON_ID=420281 /ORGANISM="Proboscia inermis, Strain CCAP1064/1" /LENGTH=106 /DNA_ID=CAMNT_0011802393 /DNA_START=812 /DNA_END=1132 /DNA_ORIENTATION=+